MRIDTHNYQEMRAWLRHVTPKVFPHWSDPVEVLDRTAAVSPANARKGLAMAVGDLLDFTSDWSDEQVRALDSSLTEKELPTLSAVRLMFSQVVRRVVGRGRIKSLVEYHALRNAVELDQDNDALWKLLSDYENDQAI